ncbi:MAG TPA: hypothetical protein VFR77_06530, partial [Steroidobacteraceae bacterium]|nr:hypothetical protein [Steroidobacteraceae bacterium]
SPAAPATGPTAHPGATEEMARLRQLDRALHGMPHAGRLSDQQYARLERAYLAEQPQDARAWATDYFAGFQPTTNQTPSTPTTPTPVAAGAPTPPASNTGSPAPPTVPTEDTPLWRMSEADRAAFLKQKGAAAFRTKYYSDLRLTKVRVRGY